MDVLERASLLVVVDDLDFLPSCRAEVDELPKAASCCEEGLLSLLAHPN